MSATFDRLKRKEQYAEATEVAMRTGEEAALVGTMRELCQRDLFYLLTVGLGRSDVDNDWLFMRCREIQENPDGYLDLWAREHYKSTLITFGKTIQDILVNPEITVGIFSHTKSISRAFLRQIKFELETNHRLKYLFPDILYADPRKEAPRWSEDKGIVVKRVSNPKESTVEAWGLVDGQPTSKHYTLLVYDDVVTRESVTTPEMMKKTTEAWELSLNLGAQGGKTRYIGTRYHYNDTWATIIERKAAVPRIHPATDDGTPAGKPVFMPRELLDDKRSKMGPYTFACQMLQDPKADEAQGFSADWLRYWTPVDYGQMNIYIVCDPANEKRKDNDYTAFWVVGLGSDRNYYVLDMIRDRINLTERTAKLFELHRLYKPLGVGYEKYGMQSDIEHIEYVQGLQQYRFDITPLGGSTPKLDRIRRLIPVFEQGRIYLPERLVRPNYEGRAQELVSLFVNEEYLPFPVMAHDDMLDALARLVDPEFETAFPTVIIESKYLTQAERDWAHITNEANPIAHNIEE